MTRLARQTRNLHFQESIMNKEQFQVPVGYKLVKAKEQRGREPKRTIIRAPKVLPVHIRMAIDLAASIARRIQEKKKAEAEKAGR
jgi:hypothetical protein